MNCLNYYFKSAVKQNEFKHIKRFHCLHNIISHTLPSQSTHSLVYMYPLKTYSRSLPPVELTYFSSPLYTSSFCNKSHFQINYDDKHYNINSTTYLIYLRSLQSTVHASRSYTPFRLLLLLILSI